jgi:hypothetical protein
MKRREKKKKVEDKNEKKKREKLSNETIFFPLWCQGRVQEGSISDKH